MSTFDEKENKEESALLIVTIFRSIAQDKPSRQEMVTKGMSMNSKIYEKCRMLTSSYDPPLHFLDKK